MDHAAPKPRRIFLPVQWLISPRADLVGILGSVGVAWAMFALWSTGIVSATELILFWVFVLHGPHFWGTISRTYADREQFRKRRKLLLGSLSWFVIGPAVIVLGLFYQARTGRADLIQLFFLLAMVWAFHHVAKQHFGFLALYRAKHREFHKREFLFCKRYLLISLWMPAIILISSNVMLEQLPGVGAYWHSGEHAIIVIQSTQRIVHAVAYWTFWIAQAAFASFVIWRVVTGRGVNLPALLLILCAVPLSWVVIMTAAAHPAAFLVVVPVLTSYHNIQYHALVWHYNRSRYTGDNPSESEHAFSFGQLVRWLSPRRVARAAPTAIVNAICALFAKSTLSEDKRQAVGIAARVNKNLIVYGTCGLLYTFATIGVEHYQLAILTANDPFSLIMKAFFWGFAFHHYYLDSKIWRASEDAELRQILGFQGPKKPAPEQPVLTEDTAPLPAKVSEAG